MKQTAVEWLVEQFRSGTLPKMDKEQKINAHIEGQRVFDKHAHKQWTTDQAEQYYNETYGKSNS
jgi:hypothetical protein